jgi:hypothetical protein
MALPVKAANAALIQRAFRPVPRVIAQHRQVREVAAGFLPPQSAAYLDFPSVADRQPKPRLTAAVSPDFHFWVKLHS